MVIVDALTNNVNRTAADVRAAFGKTAETWVSAVLFPTCLIIQVSLAFFGDDADEILEYLMEKDIDVRDVVEEDGQIIVYTEPEDFHHAQEALKEKGIEEFTVTELEMVPQNEVTLEGDDLANFEKC